MTSSASNTFEVGLILTNQQKERLRSLRDGLERLDVVSAVFPFRLEKKFGVARCLVVPGPMFSVHIDHVTVRGLGALKAGREVRYSAAGMKKKYLALIEKPVGWSAYVTMARPSRKRPEKAKKRERLHHEAAIFVTDNARARKVSGGLPSLGKRR